MGLTTDPKDPRLGHGVGGEGMNEAYLVLSEDERAKEFIRPVRRTYVHETCGVATTMGQALAETYARNPSFYCPAVNCGRSCNALDCACKPCRCTSCRRRGAGPRCLRPDTESFAPRPSQLRLIPTSLLERSTT